MGSKLKRSWSFKLALWHSLTSFCYYTVRSAEKQWSIENTKWHCHLEQHDKLWCSCRVRNIWTLCPDPCLLSGAAKWAGTCIIHGGQNNSFLTFWAPPFSSSLGPTSHKSASITDKCGSEPSPIKLITKTLTLAFNTGFTRTECHPP